MPGVTYTDQQWNEIYADAYHWANVYRCRTVDIEDVVQEVMVRVVSGVNARFVKNLCWYYTHVLFRKQKPLGFRNKIHYPYTIGIENTDNKKEFFACQDEQTPYVMLRDEILSLVKLEFGQRIEQMVQFKIESKRNKEIAEWDHTTRMNISYIMKKVASYLEEKYAD